jgi:hypothetical protein
MWAELNLPKPSGLALCDTTCHSRDVSEDNMRATERLRHWLGEAAKEYREAKPGLRITRIADELEVNVATIERFEKGLHWPKHPEALALVYAQAADVRNDKGEIDARLIFTRATELWCHKGHRPLTAMERAREVREMSPGQDIAESIEAAAKSSNAQERKAPGEGANASRKRRRA